MTQASEYAKKLDAILRKQGDKQTATLKSVSNMAHFRIVLIRAGIEYKEKFAMEGKALKYIFVDGPISEYDEKMQSL